MNISFDSSHIKLDINNVDVSGFAVAVAGTIRLKRNELKGGE